MSSNTLVLFLTLCISNLVLGQTRYAIKDLQILSSNKDYYEFFKHARDILPSKRDTQWTQMVEDLGIDYLTKVNTKSKLDDKDLKLINEISKWPTLAQNEFYNKKRDFIFLKQIKNCYKANTQEHQKCTNQANVIDNDFSHDIEFSFALVTFLKERIVIHSQVWPFAKKITSQNMGEFYCNKEPLRSIIIQELLTQTSSGKLIASDFSKDCIKTIKATLEQGIISNDIAYNEMSYKVLNQYSLLTQSSKYSYSFIRFMRNSHLSKKQLDHSLKTLKILAQQPEVRQSILKEYLKLDPLVDNLFSYPSNRKDKARIRILNRHYPEVIDAYSHKCLNYLTGNGKFPHGNPTPKCHQLFKLSKELNILPANSHAKYDKATYFIKK